MEIQDGRKSLIEIMDCDLKCFDEPWSLSFWRHIVRNDSVDLAYVNGQVAGFVLYGWDYCFPFAVRIYRLGVKKQFRKQGVARELIKRAEAFAIDIDKSKLVAPIPVEFLDSAIFLKQCGFNTSGKLKEFFACGDELQDGLLFEKEIHANP